MTIALYHFHVTQIKRSAGQSAIASAVYRSGEKLHSEYYGEDSDYTRKGGVVCSEILLPAYAPSSYSDRETLWNAVEKAERGKKAQLAYSFDIALQNEFSIQENIDLAKQFLLEQFVSRGMIVDFAVHQPDKEDGGISNLHFHVMCPIRPLDEHGKWGNKQRREYLLDENGERICDEAGNYVFNAVPTTDWGSPETLEHWREQWAALCNQKFAEKELSVHIDHRSYERQGVEQIPTIHEGVTVRAMESKGIRTDKGDLNLWIKTTNAMLREAKQKIAKLIDWLKEVKVELSNPQTPLLTDILGNYYTKRNRGAYSDKAKTANLQKYADAVSFLQSKNLVTVDDLETLLNRMQGDIETLKESDSQNQSHIEELDELLRMAAFYREGKPIADKLNTIHFAKLRQKYKAEHEHALHFYYLAERKLKGKVVNGKLPVNAWQEEKETREAEYESIQQKNSILCMQIPKSCGRSIIPFVTHRMSKCGNRPSTKITMSTDNNRGKERVMNKNKEFEHELDTELLEEIRQWEEADHNVSATYHFSNPDPYLKPQSLSHDRIKHRSYFNEGSYLCTKNISAFWIPELTVTEVIHGTTYTVAGSYEGEVSFLKKLERITARKFTEKMEDFQ
ncbi:MAG: MobA/MobL family protein [Oscillospiraceae bacterium]|nr:MobA/MobL family protein [Oscillospiraceae bacterium]